MQNLVCAYALGIKMAIGFCDVFRLFCDFLGLYSVMTSLSTYNKAVSDANDILDYNYGIGEVSERLLLLLLF